MKSFFGDLVPQFLLKARWFADGDLTLLSVNFMILCRDGQQWTTHTQLKNGPYMNKWTKYEPGLYAFNTEPKVGIGQRAFLIQTARNFSTLLHLQSEACFQMSSVLAIRLSLSRVFGLWGQFCESSCLNPQSDVL